MKHSKLNQNYMRHSHKRDEINKRLQFSALHFFEVARSKRIGTIWSVRVVRSQKATGEL